jgi:hypothetical protein
VLSTLGVDRAVPMWGTPEAGQASDQTLKTTLFSALAPLLAHHGVHPGASIYGAAAALVTADTLAARRDPWGITRFAATASACGRGIAAARARTPWAEGGGRAQTPPTKHRPGTCDKVAEGTVPFYGQASRAVVVHASSQEQRRQQHLARESQAS